MTPTKRRTTPLTRDELFQRALQIVDQDGLEALTMRRLAQEVGVEAASLYHHIPSKQALIDGALRCMRAEVQDPDATPDDWMGVMEAIFIEYRRVLTAHPHMMSLAGRRLDEGHESGLEYLVSQGFSEDEAVELFQSLMAFVVGFSMFSSQSIETGGAGLAPDLGARMTQWHDETCSKTLRMIMQAHESSRS